LETILGAEPVVGLGNTPTKCNKPLVKCERLAVVFDANDEEDVYVKRYCSEHAADHEYFIRKLQRNGMVKPPAPNWKVIPEHLKEES
jgi:hypothetical protein